MAENKFVDPGAAAAQTNQQVADPAQSQGAAGAVATPVVPPTPAVEQRDQANADQVAKINRDFQEKSIERKAQELGIPYVDIGKTPLNPDLLRAIDIDTIQKLKVVPFFKSGKKIRVAVEDVSNTEFKSLVEQMAQSGYELLPSLASADGISEAIATYAGTQKYKKVEVVDKVATESIQTYEKEISDLEKLPQQIAPLTAEQGLNMINLGAMKTGVSDVHYEPEEASVIVRFRIDGVLHKVFELPHSLYHNIGNQIKYESKMQLNVSSIPQDGRYTFMFNDQKIAVRVSAIPTPNGESFVCRFLVGSEKPITLEDLGFQGLALTKLQKAAKISSGMILSTGPTGSGKTTTLYSLLKMMNNPENKVITLEDPVEYALPGVTQSQINEKRGYTFASGLRTVLRQDPDIVMLGEIRDLETAETATQAALTGHILLSTLHTNSAIEAIPRLINMGLPPFMTAPALNTIVAQRLVRKICPDCSEMKNLEECEKREFEQVIVNLKNVNKGIAIEIPQQIPKVNGCDKCSHTGYKGRLVVAEVITINSEMKNLILKEASSVDLIAAARKSGIITMREDGFIKVAQGLTTLEEVHRVTNVI